MAKPLITVAYTRGEDGQPDEVLFYMNPEGRDLLVKELSNLDERWDHIHLQDEESTIELPLQTKAYRADEQIVYAVKMMLRPEEWDRKHFPHVLENKAE